MKDKKSQCVLYAKQIVLNDISMKGREWAIYLLLQYLKDSTENKLVNSITITIKPHDFVVNADVCEIKWSVFENDMSKNPEKIDTSPEHAQETDWSLPTQDHNVGKPQDIPAY